MGEALCSQKRGTAGVGVPTMIAGGVALLIAGLIAPLIEDSKVGGLVGDQYSIWDGVTGLAKDRHYGLAALIFAFSFVFPTVKWLGMAYVWWAPISEARQQKAIAWLDRLGKWSMLDVLVVVILMGVVHFGWLAEVSPRAGVYLFGGSIFVSMLTITWIARLAGVEAKPWKAEESLGGATPWVALIALGFLGLGMFLPLLHAEKWIFWNREYSLLTGAIRLVGEGYPVMALFVALFVILTPIVRVLAILILCWSSAGSEARRNVETISRWAMLDVLAVALLVVSVKVGDMVQVEVRPGLWCLLIGMTLAACLDWPLRRWLGTEKGT